MAGGDLGVAELHLAIALKTVNPFQLQLVLESYNKYLSTQQLTIPHLCLDLLAIMILD